MAETTVRIRVPKMVRIKDDTAREMRKTVEAIARGLHLRGKFTVEQINAIVVALLEVMPEAERDSPISELVETVLNTNPTFTGGRTKTMRMAFRIQEAFEGKMADEVVELTTDAHDMLKKCFEDPQFAEKNEKGEKKVVNEPPVNAYIWRQWVPYMDAICEPMKDEPVKLALEPPKPEPVKDEPKPAEPAPAV